MTTTICDFHFYDRALIAQTIAAHGDPSTDPYFSWPLSFKDTGYMLLYAHDIAASLTVANPGLLFGSDMIPFADAFGIFYPLSATYIAESVIVQATKEGPRFYLTLTSDGGTKLYNTDTALQTPLAVNFTTYPTQSDLALQLIQGCNLPVDIIS